MPRVNTSEKPREATVAQQPQQSGPETTLVEIVIDRSVEPTTWGLHIDCELTQEQSLALRRVASALDGQRAVLRNGRRVTESTHALKYLLEQIQ